MSLDPTERRLCTWDDDVGCTPLHNAAWKGDMDRLRVLLEAGADPHLKDRTHASTPPGWAHFNGKNEIAAHLLDHHAPDLVDAAWLGLVDRVREILDDDPLAVDGADPTSASPLRAAAHTGQIEVVRLLLDRGAEPKVAGGETGKTALELARDQGHTDIVVMLETALP